MTHFAERRNYQRCTYPVSKLLMSANKLHWEEVELLDISAGGLRFSSKNDIQDTSTLYFKVTVMNGLSEFNLQLEGTVLRQEASKSELFYSIKFQNVSKLLQVQLDEILRANINSNNYIHPVAEDGAYAFLFTPKMRSGKNRSLK